METRRSAGIKGVEEIDRTIGGADAEGREAAITRDDYRAILDLALKADHGIRLPFGDHRAAEFVRAQFYRVRSRLRQLYCKGCHDHDCLTFRLRDGDLCILRNEWVSPTEDEMQPVEPIAMSLAEALSIPTYPRKRRRLPQK